MKRSLLPIFLIILLLLTACGAGDLSPTLQLTREATLVDTSSEIDPDTGLPGVNPLIIEGDIVMAGSSTVYPLAERMAERFEDEGYSGLITIDGIGSGAGFERFCVEGETDIATASRPIKDSESENCAAIGRDPLEFRVGTDALAIVVNPANDFVDELSLEELAVAFSTADYWSDVNPSWPSEKILRFSPGTDSGTFDFFVEAVFDKDQTPLLSSTNLQLSEDDNVLVRGIKGSPYAITYFGYAYYSEHAADLTVVSIERTLPSAETVEDSSYELSRPLFIYTTAEIMARKPQVAAFVNFFLSWVDEEITDIGYFAASDEVAQAARDAWSDAQ